MGTNERLTQRQVNILQAVWMGDVYIEQGFVYMDYEDGDSDEIADEIKVLVDGDLVELIDNDGDPYYGLTDDGLDVIGV